MVQIKTLITLIFMVFLGFIEPSSRVSIKTRLGNVLFCYDYFLPTSLSDSLSDVEKDVYGQPFVQKTLIPSLEKHFNIDVKRNIGPRKPFVLRINGPTGVGKTFVAEKLLNSNFFRNKFFFSLTTLVVSSPLKKIKEDLLQTIVDSVVSCRRSIFVFDDVDAVPPEFFGDLPPFDFTKYNLQAPFPIINEQYFRESLFVYISQSDSDTITSTTENFLRDGTSRDFIGLEKFLKSMRSSDAGLVETIWSFVKRIPSNFNNEIDSTPGYIALYIPFLPLEPSHVKACIKQDILESQHNWNEKILRDVLSSVHCYPEDSFCPYGCKMVNSKVSIALNRHDEL